jgi:hypothetical protein
MEIAWPTGQVKAGIDAYMCDFLIANFPHIGRGGDMPLELQRTIAGEGEKHQMSIKQCMSLRRQMLRALYGSKVFDQDLQMGDSFSGLRYAEEFENIVAKKLIDLNLHFWDETEQKQRQRRGMMSKHGTPDFLLKAPTRINGCTVNWIECKTYFGSPTMVTIESRTKHKIPMQITMKNIANYLHYGPGAVIFLNGFGPDLQNIVTANIGPCLLLEASNLDLSSLNNF